MRPFVASWYHFELCGHRNVPANMQNERDHPKRKRETDEIYQRLACMMQERISHREFTDIQRRILSMTHRGTEEFTA